jgi:superfamily II DNA helicase RecQ
MIRRYLDRRDTLDPTARRELAFQLEQGLRTKVAGVPERLSPERFLEAIAERKARVR